MNGAAADPCPDTDHRRVQRRRRRQVHRRRLGLLITGLGLVIGGAILLPTPVPVGAVMLLVGLYLLARVSRRARLLVVWLRRRLPAVSRFLNDNRHRVPPRVRHFIDRTDPALVRLPPS